MKQRQVKAGAVRAAVRRLTRRPLPLPEWIADAAAGAPRVLLCADRAVVEGCRAVAELRADTVILETDAGRVRVEGRALGIGRVCPGSVAVCGVIRSVALPESGRG